MKLPHSLNSLYFRISAAFLLLLAIGAVACYLWIHVTVIDLDTELGENLWPPANVQRRLSMQVLVVILVTAAASGLIGMAYLSRRLRALRGGVRALQTGDLQHRIPVDSRDEIGELSGEFNSMATRLANTIEQLRQSEELHRQFVANISHDMRTPLTTVLGFIETLLDQPDRLTPEERDQYLANIARNIHHLDRLIQHVLHLSRLDSDQARFQSEDFQLEELTAAVLDRCEGMATESGVTLEVQTSGGMPTVYADPLQIGQALQNLVENGIKFNRPGGRVMVHLQTVENAVEVLVLDDGEGIPPEDLPNIFERYYTADKRRSRKDQSSGLGLAIAYKILAGHERQLVVESSPGQGTRFRFSLPVTKSTLPGPES